ncbi:MAG: VWA domain-containing protein [Muribaculaceae bacterium]|nr:VWA domain-containing protein [Muribaculaceae bacterium]
MSRRLPVYLLIDTSGSMKGEPIESVKVGIEAMFSTLRSDPYALDTVSISIITFDREVKQVLPLTPIDKIQMPDITTPESGPTHTGAALEMLCERVDSEVRKSTPDQKGDWMPILFLMTDGKPSDLMVYKAAVEKVKQRHFSSIVALAAGPKAKTDELLLLTDMVYQIDTMDGTSLMKFFKWVSGIIEEGGKSIGATDDLELPPPPSEINVII